MNVNFENGGGIHRYREVCDKFAGKHDYLIYYSGIDGFPELRESLAQLYQEDLDDELC